jgi:hypothetical protein
MKFMGLQYKRHVYTIRLTTRLLLGQVLGELLVKIQPSGWMVGVRIQTGSYPIGRCGSIYSDATIEELGFSACQIKGL